MTTLAPVIDAIADVKGFSLFVYAGVLWSIYVRENGALELHKQTDAIEKHTSIDVIANKARPSAAAIDDELCIVWEDPTLAVLYFSRWSFITRAYTQAPFTIANGRSPALKVYKTNRLVLGHRNGFNQHVYRISKNLGLTWSGEIPVDPIATTDVDLDVYPPSDNIAYWAETN